MTQTITNVPYMYRDADNYKSIEEVSLRGGITEAQRALVTTLLDRENYGEPLGFLPELIGWPHPLVNEAWDVSGDVDHHWCELDITEAYTREVSDEVYEGITRDLETWISALISARIHGWDVTKIPAENLQILV